MKTKISFITKALVLPFLIGPMLCAAADMEVHTQGSVKYMQGGVGDEEAAAIKAAMHDYSLVMTFAFKDGAKSDFVADVDVAISSSSGTQVLTTRAGAPYLLVKLPPGTYRVVATHAGRSLTKTVKVGASTSTPVVFDW